MDNLVSYFRNDSVFINDLYRPYEEFVDTGSEMVFKNRNFLLIQKGDYTIVYSVKTKKKAKLKGSISRVNTDNNYLVISAQIKDNGKKEILALDQDFKVVVPKQAGYHYFETNEMVAVFIKKGEPSNNVGRRARSAAPFVIYKGNKLRITSNIKEVTLLSNYLTLETIDDTYGLMGFSGQMLTDLSYDEMEGFSKVNSLKRNGVTSLVNKQGKVVFEWPYESAEIILDKYYVLKRKLNDRNFVIDANDNLIIDIDTTGFYTYSGRKEYGAEFIIAKSKLINKLYDCTGKLLSEWKTDTSDYSETRGVITSSNFLVAYDLDMFSTLDLDSVKEINPSGIFRRSHKGKHNNNYSLVNHKGEAITSIHDVIWDQDDGLYVTKTLSGKIGMVRVSY